MQFSDGRIWWIRAVRLSLRRGYLDNVQNTNPTAMVTQDFRSQLVALEPSLLRFARSLTTNADDARDLLQETYLRALTFQESYRSPSCAIHSSTATVVYRAGVPRLMILTISGCSTVARVPRPPMQTWATPR